MSGLLPWRDALSRIADAVSPGAAIDAPVEVRSTGLRLAEDVRSRWDFPSADVSVMDGFAARTADLIASRPVLARVGESAAGHPSAQTLRAGEAARISTGAVIPNGADVVIPQEDVTVRGDSVEVDLDAFGSIEPGRWIRRRASEVRAGDVVLRRGRQLAPADLAVLASTGHTKVPVFPRPRVAVVSTGDELVPRGQQPPPGKVVASNDLLVSSSVIQAGGIPVDFGFARDEPARLREVLTRALTCDLIVTTGGISVGDHDLVAQTFRALGITWAFHGIGLRPGKPFAFGTGAGTHVFALPGNPASAWVTFQLFVAAGIARIMGAQGVPTPRSVSVELRTPLRGAGTRAHFVRVRRFPDGTASALPTQSSGDVRSMGGADALVEVPPGVKELAAGTRAEAFLLHPWSSS